MSPDPHSGESAEPMTCPSCQQQMHVHERLRIPVAQCDGCRGIFLPRSSLGDMVETENDWHASRGPNTQPLPRISPGMTAPPSAPPPATRPARSFLDALFG